MTWVEARALYGGDPCLLNLETGVMVHPYADSTGAHSQVRCFGGPYPLLETYAQIRAALVAAGVAVVVVG